MDDQNLWALIHRIADFAGAGTIITLAWRYALKARKFTRWIEGDHRKITALWREHGYGEWDGLERRKDSYH
jgi:hypothetical protein